MDNKDIKKESNVEESLPKLNQEESGNENIKKVPTNNPSLENNVDFSAIFNVESEEKKEEPVKPNDKDSNDVSEENKERSKQLKNVSFNGQERLLYEIKPEKEGNPIVVVLFFLLLFGAILSLPYISKKVSFDAFPTAGTTTPTTEEEEDEYYYFNRSSVRAELGDLQFTNFVKYNENGNYLIRFNISNTAETPYQFNKKYYIVLYDGDSIVYHALIHSYEAIGSYSVSEVKATISKKAYENANRFKLAEINESQYPTVRLIEEDGDYNVLTCTYKNDEVKYYFIDGKLEKLKETYTEEIDTSTNYNNNLITYRNLSQEYKKIDNFQSTFIEDSNSFTMINTFNHKDISDITLYNLKAYRFFKYSESKDVVSFELEAQGYTCS